MSSAITHQADLKNRPDDGLLLATTPTLPGFRVLRVIGLVRGNTIRTRHVGNDIVAALRNLVGGEIPEYTKLMGESREQALDRMRAEASRPGGERHPRRAVHHGDGDGRGGGDARVRHRRCGGAGLAALTQIRRNITS
jgi:hypothetical protein